MNNSKPPLRIMQIVGTSTGGTWFLDQVTTLAARGHEILAVVPSEGDLTNRLRDAGIDVVVIPFKGKGARNLPRIIKAQWDLIRLVRTYRPDIVHAHLLKAILVGRIAAFLGRAPVRISQWPGSVHLDVKTFRILDRATLWIDSVTVGSCRDIANRYIALGATNTAVNYYGCDVHRVDPATSGTAFREEYGMRDDQPTVGMVAHMYPTNLAAFRRIGVKGHEVFIDAASIVLATRPDVHFFIVGDELVGNGSYRRRLEARVRDLELQDLVTFTGHRTDIPTVMAAMDVLVNPSLSESASYTMVESLLMKKGAVASNVGGLPDTIQHRETGLLVPPRSPEALAEAILWMLDHPEDRASMAALGRDRVLEKFDIERTVNVLLEIYRCALIGNQEPLDTTHQAED